jgi:ribosomal-protein-serine acetyltransferase
LLIPTTLPLLPGVELRTPAPDDAAEVAAVVRENFAHLEPWMGWVRPDYGMDDALQWMAEGSELQRLIVRDGRPAGTIGFHQVDGLNHATSIGYWLAAEAQGHGIVTTAVRELCRLAFEAGIHRIELRAAPHNRRSRAVAERCGFSVEGVAREAEHVGGGFRDLVVYSLLAPSGGRSTFSEG